MNSRHQGFKKLVLGTTLMCCAGMSTVEAGPWDWLKNLFAGGEIAKLSKDVVRLEQEVKFLERSNKVKACIIVAGGAAGAVACCYYFFKKQPGTAENAVQIAETQQEQDETQAQDLNTAGNETRTENEAPVQPKVRLFVNDGQDLALCKKNAENDLKLQEIAKSAVDQVIQGALEDIRKKEERAKWFHFAVLSVKNQKVKNLKKALQVYQDKVKKDRVYKRWARFVIQGQKRDREFQIIGGNAIRQTIWQDVAREEIESLWGCLEQCRTQLTQARASEEEKGKEIAELKKTLEQYKSQLAEVGDAMGIKSLSEQNIPQSVSALIEANRNLSEAIKNGSETMKSQQKTIQDLVRIVQNGEIIMLQILSMCKGSFDANSVAGYSVNNTAQLDAENKKFIGTEQGAQLAIIMQNQENSGTIVAVRNAERSLCVLQQCLQGVEAMENRNKEAIAQAQAEVSELSRANSALQQKNKGAMEQVLVLQKEKAEAKEATQQAEQRIATLQSQSRNKVLTKAEEDAIIRKRIGNTGMSVQQKNSIERALL